MRSLETNPTTEKILSGIRALQPLINASLVRMDKECCLPSEIVQGMIAAGVFRASVPEAYGGYELDPMAQMQIVEECSRLDGSVGWIAMIGVSGGHLAAFLGPTEARELFGGEHSICAGQASFTGQHADVVPGGYRVTGRFRFGSGINHASVLFRGVALYEDGQQIHSPSGAPVTRLLLVPSRHAQIIENWDTTGMRGTGGHDFVLENVFVPEAQTFQLADPPKHDSPLYRYQPLYLIYHAGVPLGIARAVLDEAYELSKTKRVPPSSLGRSGNEIHRRTEGVEAKVRVRMGAIVPKDSRGGRDA